MDFFGSNFTRLQDIKPLESKYDRSVCEHRDTTPAYTDGDEFIMWCNDCDTEFHLKGEQIDDAFIHI